MAELSYLLTSISRSITNNIHERGLWSVKAV